MSVSIKDVAREAGVAISTVSKVINGRGNISEETTLRVRQVMEELHYVPNSLARSLVTQKSGFIAYVMDLGKECAFRNPYLYEIMAGIEEALHERDYALTIISEKHFRESPESLARLIHEKKVDGMILPSDLLDSHLAGIIKKSGFPCVLGGENLDEPDFSWIDMDNRKAGFMAAEHLYLQGYRKVLFLRGNENNCISSRREEGMHQSGRDKNDLTFHIYHSGEGRVETGSVLESLLVGRQIDFDSLVCSNLSVPAVIEVLKKYKHKIPETGIICFDNYPYAPFSSPPVSAVDLDLFDLGRKTAELLFWCMENPGVKASFQLLPPKVIQRKSTTS